jgi:AcrR family transcriptional regulator
VQAGSHDRREQARRDLRERILGAATDLFTEGGADAVTMRAVAERIGYSATTIYLHFPDRDALLFAIVDNSFGVFGERMRVAIASSDDPRERLSAMGRAYVTFALDHPAHYRLMFIQRPDYLLAHGPEEDRARIESLGALSAVAIAVAARRGTHSADLRLAPDTVADAVWGAVHGIAALATGVPIFDRARALAATEASVELLATGLGL